MRAVHIVAPGKVEMVETPKPVPGPGEVLVRPLLEALCGSDIRGVYYSPEDEYPHPVGRAGHEVIAVIEETNEGRPATRVGDIALTLVPGECGMCEYFVAPSGWILPLPEGPPLEHLLMAQQLGTVLFSCKRLPSVVGQSVAIIGQGSAGLFWDVMLRRMGADTVIALDLKDARLKAALKFGATHTVNNAQTPALEGVTQILNGKLADLVVEAAGEPDAINLAATLVKERGRLVYFGIPRGSHRFEFDFWELFRKYCDIITNAEVQSEPGLVSFKSAIRLIANGDIDVSPMISHHIPFDRVFEAYELARSRDDGALKIIIEMPGYTNPPSRQT